jgi:type IV secretion system protein VirB10
MTRRATVAGERADAIEMPGVARRAAAYRLIFGVTLVLAGAGFVLTYYWHHHHPEVRTASRSPTARAAATEMRLPKLNLPEAPHDTGTGTEASPITSIPGGAPTTLAVPPVPALPSLGPMPGTSPGASLPATSLPVTVGAHRREVSPVLIKAPTTVEAPVAPATQPAVEAPQRPTVKVLHASALPAQRFLLPRGSFLDCTLETAVDSTLAGLATCLLSADVYGADGTVVLLPRGSRLVGDTHSDVRAGQARVGITWTEARTPQGLVLPLGAPGTDALGRTGVPGSLDRHTTERFGAAVMLSVIDSAVSALVNRRQAGNGVVYNVQGSRDVATEALRQSIHIPPTIRVDPGARVDVIVTTDVDFADVYRLVPHESE